MAKAYRFKALLTENGWVENAVVQLNREGMVQSVSSDEKVDAEYVDGFALPGFQNAHSHAFQYAMAGLAELHTGTGVPDDFWSWRNAMYSLALQLSPDQMEAVATMLYAEMLRHGYTAVAEFHYVHHDPEGKPYGNLAELGERLVAAAQKTGIQLTLVPMFYQMGGFGMEPEAKQRRFISPTLDDYLNLLESSSKAVSKYSQANLGMGVHSLRAVKGEDIVLLSEKFRNDRPFHIHVAEQKKEITDSLAFYGHRPVEWLLQNVNVTDNYHLVHATHLSDAEVAGIAKAGAHVVLCPSTEGNLGDGLFRFHDFKALGGKWSIGTDSHVGLNPLEELRVLDYGQRLITHKRNTFFEEGKGDSGFNAIQKAFQSGKKAMGKEGQTFFKEGNSFDAVIYDAKAPLLAASGVQNLCNTIVYSCDVSHQLGTMVKGEWVIKEGLHSQQDTIQKDFVKALKAVGVRQ